MTRADTLLVLFALLFVGGSYYLAWQPSVPGSRLDVYQGNSLYKQQRLDEPAILHVPGKLGESVIEVNQGRARFQASPCTSKFCIHAGWLQHAGDVIACLPNGIHIQVHGGQSQFDALAF